MQDEEFGAVPDVFAEVASDPDPATESAADPLADATDPLAGVEEAELPGDNPGEEFPAGEEFMEEPIEPEMEAELPGESDALAAAEAATPAPQAADPLADAEPVEAQVADPAPAEPAPAAEPEPAAAPAAAEPAEPAAKPKKEAKKPAAKKEKKAPAKKEPTEAAAKKSERNYVVLYQVEGGTFAVGPTVLARTTALALEKAFTALSKELGVTTFSAMVPVPETAWRPEPVKGETEQVSRVSIGE